MKLYYHPASTTCRPIMLFAAENGIDLDLELVDLVYGVVYPQILPNHRRRSDEAQDATLQWGSERARGKPMLAA